MHDRRFLAAWAALILTVAAAAAPAALPFAAWAIDDPFEFAAVVGVCWAVFAIFALVALLSNSFRPTLEPAGDIEQLLAAKRDGRIPARTPQFRNRRARSGRLMSLGERSSRFDDD